MMNSGKFLGKIMLCLLVTVVLVSLTTMSNASAATNMIDDAVSIIFEMENSDDVVDFIVLLDSIADPQAFAEAYDTAFGSLAANSQDSLYEYSLTVQAITDMVLVLQDNNHDIDGDQLKSYLAVDTQSNRDGFKNALVGSNESEIISEWTSNGITGEILESGLAQMDIIYDSFARIQANPFINAQFLEANRRYGNLSINNRVANGMISLAEGANIITPHNNAEIIDDLEGIVDYYNACISTDKTIIYNYLNGFGFIKIVPSGGGSTPDPGTEPTIDPDIQEKVDVPKPAVIDGAAKAKIDQGDFADAVAAAAQAALELAEEIANSGEEQTKDIHVAIVIEVPKTGAKNIEVTLPAGAIDAAFAAGVDAVGIETELASFRITKETFGDKAVGKEVVLAAGEVLASEIPADADIPQGSLVVDLNAFIGGEKVTDFSAAITVGIPYNGTATNGESLTVFILKDDGTVEAVGGKYNAETGQVIFLTNHFSKYFTKESIKQFNDIGYFSWAENSIEILGGKGIIHGVTDSTYAPSKNITRAEFCTIIARMLQLDGYTTKVFTDVQADDWYYDAVMIAYANGIIEGNSATTFNPNGLITRQEMSVIVSRVLRSYGYLSPQSDQLSGYVDAADVADWAVSGVSLVVRQGIIKGIDDTHLAPNNNATRAESAVILYRLFNIIMTL